MAACQRHLRRRDFDRVAELYHSAADRTDKWASTALTDHGGRPAAELAGWLRDEHLAAAADPAAALITLRATQAALLLHGWLLRWNTTALGPQPARRLAGDLTAGRAAALQTFTRTDHTAAAGLSLHLNLSPAGFACWRLRDVADDGSTIRAATVHTEHGNGLEGAEQACEATITVPGHARAVIAAHLAQRRDADAGEDDPFFRHPRGGDSSVVHGLRRGIRRVNDRLNLNPPWLHPLPCRYGADVGRTPRVPGWLAERGLSLHRLDTVARPARGASR